MDTDREDLRAPRGMSSLASVDGVKLHCEERGAGPAVLFVHEYGGSCRSFDMQVEAFRARYRCVVFNARGYPPSEVPASVGSDRKSTRLNSSHRCISYA